MPVPVALQIGRFRPTACILPSPDHAVLKPQSLSKQKINVALNPFIIYALGFIASSVKLANNYPCETLDILRRGIPDGSGGVSSHTGNNAQS